MLNKPSIAIVGSRKASNYGKKYAALFSNSISGSNIAVVSGLAVGIDSVAHQYAMQENGKTIAVLGSGFSHIFPEENFLLFEQILENGGCIISEYPPETKPNSQTFPVRNRIIAGLSIAVLVIEAKYRSGSSITAKYALEEGKPVFCLPHSIEDPYGVGCNRLLKKGAKLLTKASELGEYLHIKVEDKNKQEPINTERNLKRQKIQNQEQTCIKTKTIVTKRKVEKEYEPIYHLLLSQSMSSNEIAKNLQRPISYINQMLTIMEIKGYIQAIPGNEFVIKGE